MKIPVLNELQTEINRLFVAGSKFAKDDPRLKRLVPALEKMGERAPIFTKLSRDLSALAESDSAESAYKLLEIGTLMYSIIYTQGDAAAAGDFEPAVQNSYNSEIDSINTNKSYLQLEPLINALTSQNSGRLEIICSAYENGMFSDIRTHEAAVSALDDKYSELVSELTGKIIPYIGKSAVPHLLRQYDPSGGQSAGRRLSLLSRLGYSGAEKLAHEAIENSGTSIPVSVAAIELLGKNPENHNILVALCGDKKRELREAAMIAAAVSDLKEGKQIILRTFAGKNYISAIVPLTVCRDVSVKLEALEILKGYMRECLVKGLEKKQLTARAEKFLKCADALSGEPHPLIIGFIKEILTSEKLRKALSSVNSYFYRSLYRTLLNSLLSFKSAGAKDAIKELAHNSTLAEIYNPVVSCWFFTAAKSFTKEKMYEEFAPFYRKELLNYSDFKNNYSDVRVSLDVRWFSDFLKCKSKNEKIHFLTLAVEMADTVNVNHMRSLLNLVKDDLREYDDQRKYPPYYLNNLFEKLRDANMIFELQALSEHAYSSYNRYHSALKFFLKS